jgi:hypothetical protein
MEGNFAWEEKREYTTDQALLIFMSFLNAYVLMNFS